MYARRMTTYRFAEDRPITCSDCGAQSDNPADFHFDGPDGPECTNAFIAAKLAEAREANS
jgi:hypothetical protein